jgi:hypothetical protein
LYLITMFLCRRVQLPRNNQYIDWDLSESIP